MAPISNALRDSLTALSKKIAEAEAFLKKQPGADKASVDLDDDQFGRFNYLEVMRTDDGDCRICVRCWDHPIYGDEKPEGKPIEDFPVSIRIKLCDYIEELLDGAVAAEEAVTTEAMEAADKIEQALAKVKGDN